MSLKQLLDIHDVFIQIFSFLPKYEHFKSYQYVNKYFYDTIQFMQNNIFCTSFLDNENSFSHFHNGIYIKYKNNEINELNLSTFKEICQVSLEENIWNKFIKENDYLELLTSIIENNNNETIPLFYDNFDVVNSNINTYLNFFYTLAYLYKQNNVVKYENKVFESINNLEIENKCFYILEVLIANRSIVITDDLFLFKLFERIMTLLFSFKKLKINNFYCKQFYNEPLNLLNVEIKNYLLENEICFILFILENWIKNYGFNLNNFTVLLEDFIYLILNVIKDYNFNTDLITKCKSILGLLFKINKQFDFKIYKKLNKLLNKENLQREEIFNNNPFIKAIKNNEPIDLLLQNNLDEFIFNFLVYSNYLFINITYFEMYNQFQFKKENYIQEHFFKDLYFVKLYPAFCNNIVNFFTNYLLNLETVDLRADYYLKLIQLCCYFFNLNDYNATILFYVLFENGAIHRLRLTLDKLYDNLMSKKLQNLLEEIKNCFRSDGSFKNLRNLMKSSSENNIDFIPYIGLFFSDITFIKDTSNGNQVLNFTKCKVMATVMKEMFSCKLQKTPIICQEGTKFIKNNIPSNILDIINNNNGFFDKLFKKNKEIEVTINENYLELFIYLTTDYIPIEDTELFSLSLKREPRKTY
ncbi:hypothetical protein ABK040_006684 [Willaertia magna]